MHQDEDMQTGRLVSDIRPIRMPDWLWVAVRAKAVAHDLSASLVVRELLMTWLATKGAGMEPEQLALIAANVPQSKPGPYERMAAKRIRELGKAGFLTPETAGYADGLRLAGRNLDKAEEMGASVPARINAADAWERALNRIVPPPVDAQRETQDDPWKALAEDLRQAANP
jgi:hypothetical protein